MPGRSFGPSNAMRLGLRIAIMAAAAAMLTPVLSTSAKADKGWDICVPAEQTCFEACSRKRDLRNPPAHQACNDACIAVAQACIKRYSGQ